MKATRPDFKNMKLCIYIYIHPNLSTKLYLLKAAYPTDPLQIIVECLRSINSKNKNIIKHFHPINYWFSINELWQDKLVLR